MQALLRWRRSAHTLHSFPAPSTCFLGTISNFAFQRLPLLSAGIMVPFSNLLFYNFSHIRRKPVGWNENWRRAPSADFRF